MLYCSTTIRMVWWDKKWRLQGIEQDLRITRSLVALEPRRPPMTDVGTETAFRLDQRKHFRKSKHLLRSEVNWCDQTSIELHLRRSTSPGEYFDQHAQRHGFRRKRNHFRGQSSSRPLIGHAGCWSIAKCSQRSCRNFTGRFRSWPPATCTTRTSFDHHGKRSGILYKKWVLKNEKSRISHWSESDENAK